MHVLNVYRKTEKPAQALRAVNLARNTLRDFLGMVELKIIDERKYDETIDRVRQQQEKPCWAEIINYWQELNKKKGTKLLLHLMTQKSFYKKWSWF